MPRLSPFKICATVRQYRLVLPATTQQLCATTNDRVPRTRPKTDALHQTLETASLAVPCRVSPFYTLIRKCKRISPASARRTYHLHCRSCLSATNPPMGTLRAAKSPHPETSTLRHRLVTELPGHQPYTAGSAYHTHRSVKSKNTVHQSSHNFTSSAPISWSLRSGHQ